MDLSKLKEPFKAEDIEWRLQQCGETRDGRIWGKCLAYITSRAVQERLDEVCGTDGWRSDIRKDGNAYLCTLSIRVKHEDGSTEWISRTDGADATDIESVKGGISGAIKRAAVQFGIGRYLYDLEEGWRKSRRTENTSGRQRPTRASDGIRPHSPNGRCRKAAVLFREPGRRKALIPLLLCLKAVLRQKQEQEKGRTTRSRKREIALFPESGVL